MSDTTKDRVADLEEKLLARLEKRAKKGQPLKKSDIKLIRELRDGVPDDDPRKPPLTEKVNRCLAEIKAHELERISVAWDRNLEMRVDGQDGYGEEKRFKRFRALLALLHRSDDTDYQSLAKLDIEKERLEKHFALADSLIAPFVKTASEIVGYENIRADIADAVEYWIVRNEDFMKSCRIPPPQVFIIKGSTGTGKTMLADAAMVDAERRGKEVGLPIYAKSIETHDVINKYLGESERNLAAIFEDAFTYPMVVFMDAVQSIAANDVDASTGEGIAMAYRNIRTMLSKKLGEVEGKHCIIIMSTDEFSSLPEGVKRMGNVGTYDLDAEISRPMLVAVAKRNLERFSIDSLDPDAVVETIEDKVRSLGHSTVTPADIANAVKMAVSNKVRSLREYSKSSPGSPQPEFSIGIEDFKRLNKLKEYNEDQRSREVQQVVTRLRPKTTLDDVGGLSGVKESLLKDIRIAMNPDLAKKNGATPVRGILLHGTPGTGKTWLAQALAGETSATVYLVRGPQVMKSLVGKTEKIISDIFDEARKTAPSIILIDEIEALMGRRDAGATYMNGAVSTLLSEMSGLKPMDGVVLIGTTNKLEMIDDAFKRAGRFDRIVEILPPKNDAERIEVIKVHLNKCRSFTDSSVTEQDILHLFGRRTFTPAKIERIISDAIQLRMKELDAVRAISGVSPGEAARLEKERGIYKDELRRLGANLNLPEDQAITPEMISGVTDGNYKLRIAHFKAAVDLVRDETLDEIRKIATEFRNANPNPTVGVVYGLAALPDTASGGIAGEGMVSPILCICEPNRTGVAKVVGSEIADSVKASADHARAFLSSQSDWALMHHDFTIEFVTALKGYDQHMISGPSAGAAIALAEYSACTKQEILPNIVVTGGITIHGELVKVGGLDSKGMGKIVGALATSGVDTIVVPQANLEGISKEDLAFFEKLGLKVVPARNFWDVAKVMLASHPDEDKAKEMLRGVQDLKSYKRAEAVAETATQQV